MRIIRSFTWSGTMEVAQWTGRAPARRTISASHSRESLAACGEDLFVALRERVMALTSLALIEHCRLKSFDAWPNLHMPHTILGRSVCVSRERVACTESVTESLAESNFLSSVDKFFHQGPELTPSKCPETE
jgi:hypothetical protein